MQAQQPGNLQQHQPMDPIKSENMKHEVKLEGGHPDMKPDMHVGGEGVSKPSLSQTNPTLDNMLRNPSGGDPSGDKSGSIIDTTSGGGIVSTTEIKNDEGVSGVSEGQDEISALLGGGSSPGGPGQASEVEKALKTSEAVSASLAAASTSSPITTSTMSSPSTTFSSQQVWSLALNFFPFLQTIMT